MDYATSSPMSDQDDLEVDEYARKNGLSVDSRFSAFSLLLSLSSLRGINSPSDSANLLQDDECLPEFKVPPFHSFNEQPAISRDAAEFLSKVISRDDGNSEVEAAAYIPSFVRQGHLKLELPLLPSDNDADCHQLKESIKARNLIQIDSHFLPLEPLVASKDEGLEFPETAKVYRAQLEDGDEDRLTMPKEVLHCIVKALDASWNDEDTAALITAKIMCQRGTRSTELTPPLSPVLQPAEFFIPDSEVCQIPVSSDTSTLLGADLEAAEAAIVQEESSPLRFSTPEFPVLLDTPLVSPDRLRLDSVKVEGPLTPLESESFVPDQVADLQEGAKGLLQGYITLESDCDLTKDLTNPLEHNLFEGLQEDAMTTLRNIEQERLDTMDAVARVPIPVMDFALPEPEWTNSALDCRQHLELIDMYHVGLDIPLWHRNRAVDQELWWTPFPSILGQVSVKESIEEENTLESILQDLCPHEAPTSAAYVWKQPGLAVLQHTDADDDDDEEEEEDLEVVPDKLKNDADLHALLKKRKLEIDNVQDDEDCIKGNAAGGHTTAPSNCASELESRELLSPIDLIQLPPNAAATNTQDRSTLRLLVGNDDPSATSILLANYVDFHASKKQKTARSLFFDGKEKYLPTRDDGTDGTVNLKKITKPKPTKDRHAPSQQTSATAPCPSLDAGFKPTKIIIALNLGRGLLSRLEKLIPTAELIERDFERWNTLAWGRNSVIRSPITSPLAAEADVIVSSATGILITTLIKAIQKPLPGHTGKAAIRERIEKVSARYERLFILVSAGNHAHQLTQELSQSECTAFSEFTAFVAGLDTTAQVYYVGGGDETVSRWLISLVMRYSLEAAEHYQLLITDETTWEIILRRAGMNAFAAQVVLANLRDTDEDTEATIEKSALSKFVKMSLAEKIEKFGRIMGGERVLKRIDAVFTAEWN
ncbi:uncharacterized protein BCR38DRAFT_474129 [Pseudomassariella vexata]|uniref:Uncharacterized protein n=1 Tax=Pseudomassariella vexata TaxID=1141098 RepID=A0A1Y2E0W9_9PEZI|nr:uncharacterized protein BCR38DRAFT_474129 [Pseudomassariella vexata]ORY65182.1 hypothetical protein BCR38DRAFT_474129 [Pseudomassariella vexata]